VTVASIQEVLRTAIKQGLDWFTGVRPHPRQLVLDGEKQLHPLAEQSGKVAKFPASPSQEGLWYMNQLQPESSAYNLPVGLRFTGHLDCHALERSLQAIVNRHDALRTRFDLQETELSQVVTREFIVSLPLTDFSDVPEGRRYQETWEMAINETRLAFDLSRIPLFRLRLFRLQPNDHVLICVMHHIISDGWSLGVFVSELLTLYGAFSTGTESPLEPLPIQYGDYAMWQREALTSETFRHQLAYWMRQLQGSPPVTKLPVDSDFPFRETTESACQFAPISKELVRDLKDLSTKQDATLFMIALAAFKAVLRRYTGQDDIPIGIPTAGRDRVETEALIGYFVKILVLRTNLSGNPRFCDYLTHVREVTLEALCNCDVPFVKVVQELNPIRSVNRHANPVFQVMFAVINAAVKSQQVGELSTSPYVVRTGNSPVDLTLNLIEAADENWMVQFEYNTGLFSHERIAKLLKDYVSVLGAVALQPHLRISDLPILTRRETPS